MTIRQNIGPFAQPDAVVLVHSLPKTRSGKIMRRVLRKVFIFIFFFSFFFLSFSFFFFFFLSLFDKILFFFSFFQAASGELDQIGDISTMADQEAMDHILEGLELTRKWLSMKK